MTFPRRGWTGVRVRPGGVGVGREAVESDTGGLRGAIEDGKVVCNRESVGGRALGLAELVDPQNTSRRGPSRRRDA